MQATTRFVGLDVHRQFVMVAAVDAQQHILLDLIKVPLATFQAWAGSQLQASDQVALEATTNAWTVYDSMLPLVAEVTVADDFMGSLRRECLDYMLILSEQHLRRIVKEYSTYFNRARPHQGLHQRIPGDPSLPKQTDGEIVGIPVLGGLHHDYRRKAA